MPFSTPAWDWFKDGEGIRHLGLKLTLGMAERRQTEYPPDEESWGGVQQFESLSDPKSPSLGIWFYLSQYRLGIARTLNKDPIFEKKQWHELNLFNYSIFTLVASSILAP